MTTCVFFTMKMNQQSLLPFQEIPVLFYMRIEQFGSDDTEGSSLKGVRIYAKLLEGKAGGLCF